MTNDDVEIMKDFFMALDEIIDIGNDIEDGLFDLADSIVERVENVLYLLENVRKYLKWPVVQYDEWPDLEELLEKGIGDEGYVS